MEYNIIIKRRGDSMDTIATRIIQVVNATGGNKSEFARKVNLTPAYISKLDKQPDRMPSDRTIADICREFSVSEHWLRTGEGEMFVKLSRDEEIAAFMGNALAGENDNFKRRFLAMLSRLSEEQWDLLEQMVENIKKAEP